MDINIEIEEANQGLQLWLDLNQKYHIYEDDKIICFPTNNMELNRECLKQLGEFAKAKYLSRLLIFILESSNPYLKLIGNIQSVETVAIILNDFDMKNLIRFIRLVDTTSQVIVISDDTPFGNLNLVGKYGIDLEDYVSGSYLWRTNVTNK